MVYLKSVENVITLGKLIGLLCLFCLPLLSILFLKTKRNNFARPVMGTIFLVAMYPVSSGFEEWIHPFVQDSFGQKRETLPGATVIRVQVCN